MDNMVSDDMVSNVHHPVAYDDPMMMVMQPVLDGGYYQATPIMQPIHTGIVTEQHQQAHDQYQEQTPGPSSSHHHDTNLTQTYDEVFPALPEAAAPIPVQHRTQVNGHGPHSTSAKKTSAKLKPSFVTTVLTIPADQRRSRDAGAIAEKCQTKICSDIMVNTGTKIEMSSSKDGMLTLVISGKEDAVNKAKKEITMAVQMKSERTIQIPKEHHKFILGKSGKKLTDLENSTGTKIALPPQNDDSDAIKITGTPDAIDRAVHELKSISDQVASRANERLSIEKRFHPFIIGPYNKTQAQLQLDTGAKITVPPSNVENDEILITGETTAVSEARHRIIEMYHDMKSRYSTFPMELKKDRRKYVVGPKGAFLKDLFEKTGVYVEMPSPDSDSETITLVGERQILGDALKILFEKAHSKDEDIISVEPWVHRHIIGPKGANFNDLQKLMPDVHVSFLQDGNIRIEGVMKSVSSARKLLMEEIGKIKERITVAEMKIEPKYHRFIIGKQGAQIKQIREETKVQINIPNETDSTGPSDVIRIEGSKEAVEQARELLEQIISRQKEREAEITKEVKIEQRFHGQLIGSKGEKIKEIRQRFNQVAINFPETAVKSDVVTVRGAAEDVNHCVEFLKQRFDELSVNNHREEVPINDVFHKMVIGKERAQINKIRDETETKIDLPPPGSKILSIIVSGKRDNVRKAKESISKLQRELSDCVSKEIFVATKFHKELIGFKGRSINAIRAECGNVDIQFPPEGSGSEKVNIVGPKDMVMKAKQAIIDLKNDLEVNNYKEEVKAKPSHHKHLIGKSGSNINKLREKYQVRVLFPGDNEDIADRETIYISGKKENVIKAKAELNEQIKDLDRTVEEKVRIPLKYRDAFRKVYIRQIRERENLENVNVDIGARDEEVITVSGLKNSVSIMVEKLEQKVQELDSEITEQVEYPAQYRVIFFSSRKRFLADLKVEHNVQILPAKRDTSAENSEHSNSGGDLIGENAGETGGEIAGDDRPKVELATIRGLKSNVESAKKAFEEIVANFVTEEIKVPSKFHKNIIGPKGENIREINEIVSHMVDINVPPSESNSDVITLTGLRSNIEEAKVAIAARVAKYEEDMLDRERRNYRLPVKVDPSHHPKIIGKKGSTITKIKNDHQVQIKIPERAGDSNGEQSEITIIGYEENVNAARDALLKIVHEAEQQVSVDVNICHRIYARIIGQKRRNLMQLNREFNVNIRFPRSSDPEDAPVVVTGLQEDIDRAVEKLKALEEEYVEDLQDQYLPPTQPRMHPIEVETRRGNTTSSKGFHVKNAPWERKQDHPSMPDTNNADEFPSMGQDESESSGQPKSRWGMQGAKLVSSYRN